MTYLLGPDCSKCVRVSHALGTPSPRKITLAGTGGEDVDVYLLAGVITRAGLSNQLPLPQGLRKKDGLSRERRRWGGTEMIRDRESHQPSSPA